MKTATINLYTFSELSEKAKDKVRENHDCFTDIYFSQILQAITKVFPISSIDWFDLYHSTYITMQYDDEELEKTFKDYQTEFKYPTDQQYWLTGYCSCAFFLNELPKNEPLKRKDFSYAIQRLHTAYIKAVQYEYSDESLQEHCDANDYYFTEDGTLFR